MKILIALGLLFLPGILSGFFKSYCVNRSRSTLPATGLFWLLVLSVAIYAYNKPMHPHADFGLLTAAVLLLLFSLTNGFSYAVSNGLIKLITEFRSMCR